MKIKNKMNDHRILRVRGQIITFGPHEVMDLDRPEYDSNVFEPYIDQIEQKEQEVLPEIGDAKPKTKQRRKK